MTYKPTICVDFDGVIHSYTSGWQGVGVADDPPVPGAEEFLRRVTAEFDVCIFSTRSRSFRGRRAMKRYMREHFMVPLTMSPYHDADFLHEAVRYPWFKPPALITLDDRAICFTGTFPSLAEIKHFKPWNK